MTLALGPIQILPNTPARTAISNLTTSNGCIKMIAPTYYAKGHGASQAKRLLELSSSQDLSRVFSYAAHAGVRLIVLHRSSSVLSLGVNRVQIYGADDAQKYFGVSEIADTDPLLFYNPIFMRKSSDQRAIVALEHELWHIAIDRRYPDHQALIQGAYWLFSGNHWLDNFVNSFGHIFLRTIAISNERENFVHQDIDNYKRHIKRESSDGFSPENANVGLSIYMAWLADTVIPYLLTGDTRRAYDNRVWAEQLLQKICPDTYSQIITTSEDFVPRLIKLITDTQGSLNMFMESGALFAFFGEMKEALP